MATKLLGQKMLLAGEWVDREDKIKVYNPENNQLIDTVPAASKEDMELAIEKAKEGAKIAESLSVKERMDILQGVAKRLQERHEEFARMIALEGSKTIKEARGEVTRTIETIRISAEEARRMTGESINFDQNAGNEDRMGYYFRFPIGIVAAITPFNDPLNLVAHKIGPAIAAGNAIIVKPASETPLSALKLAEAFTEAGLPKKVMTVITGRGRDIGDTLIENKEIRMISFTGGLETGEAIAKKAGLKKVSMELGSNSPAIVLKDADLDHAVSSTVSGSFAAAGQNCLGVQRIYVEKELYSSFKDKFVQQTKELKSGNKLSEYTDMGPLINEKEAKRVEKMVEDALKDGAELLTGGKRNGAFYEPTVLANVPRHAAVAVEEIFGPVVILSAVDSFEEAIEKANDVNYGLQAGIFTTNVNKAMRGARRLQVGGVMINDSSDFRIDAMPFGGVKGSGLGREGVKYAMRDMSEERVVCFKLTDEE
ncbi:aldehyde dehydrogenase family protein [Thalassorhabdus alkalitolerans]|uniref:Aldehyde dehydrogenase family protein n=1 Tax=Thalassorhabdus alkalitolerans TaxID=2282697 RepID=A0ABW0YU75_9BACI